MTDEKKTETPKDQEENNGAQEQPGASSEEPKPESEPSEVDRLKSENAQRRIQAREAEKKAEALKQKLLIYALKEATAGILEDPEDIRLVDFEPGDFETEDGGYDVEKIKELAETLATDKPHLRKRPSATGDVGQGVRTEGPTDPNVRFAQALKRAAG